MSDPTAASFLDSAAAAAFLGISRRTLHEYTRRAEIPHRVLPRGRKCLFTEADLRAWMDGAELERIDLPHGGRVVRPMGRAA